MKISEILSLRENRYHSEFILIFFSKIRDIGDFQTMIQQLEISEKYLFVLLNRMKFLPFLGIKFDSYNYWLYQYEMNSP